MMKGSVRRSIQSALLLGASAAFMAAGATAAAAQAKLGENRTEVDIPAQPLASALRAFGVETDSQVMFSKELVEGRTNRAVKGNYSAAEALDELLKGTNLRAEQSADRVFLIRSAARTHASAEAAQPIQPMQLAQASLPRASVETVTVTSSKLGGADVQSIPIAITALSQEQLTSTQTAGGPDLVKQVPNLTFTKTNFTGYSIQIRGIGTQAISVTTDPAVAVAFNDMPFIRNHFFEQEFYDVSQVEVLRGPQGTLYGRNATAGVVNLISAKPSDQFEATASGELGNYHQRRFEGMINIPLVDDRLDIRLAGEWTKRQGYSFNETTNERIDGRDLWSGRLSIGWKPANDLQTSFVWEHFSEDDDRIRSSKQLCKRDPGVSSIGSVSLDNPEAFSQGCLPTSLYSADAFEVPNGFALPYVLALGADVDLYSGIDPYASATQSRNLRVIQSQLNPIYKAKNDIVEFQADYQISPELTLTSQTGYNHDFLWGTQDYNRFNTSPGVFLPSGATRPNQILPDGTFCDPQLGCSNRLVAQDLSEEHAWQFNQEFRLASNFSGPFNFSAGGNYMHYETEENYYVFINVLSLYASIGPVENFRINLPWQPGISNNSECLRRANNGGFEYPDPTAGGGGVSRCSYIDPNPLTKLDDAGHNYFLSQNPYILNSYAGFGEANYNVLPDLKLTAGLRWTEDRKHFVLLPSQVLTSGYGYPSTGTVDQQWDQLTGRANVAWTPNLNFTSQTLIYGSYAHGYKAGGANPPGTITLQGGDFQAVHPLTFKPEFVDAFELGTKNSLLDGNLTFNGDVFYYNYENYQISEIVDRTSINLNFDAHVKGAEVEATWEPLPGLRFNFSGGYEDARLAEGSKAVDLMDRTAGHSDWIVVKPDITEASNCIFPTYVMEILRGNHRGLGVESYCTQAYIGDNYSIPPNPITVGFTKLDPVTGLPYVPNPTVTNWAAIPPGYPGFDPFAAPNNGAGFYKDLSHNQMPNAPPFTVSAGAQYSIPLNSDWAGTLRGDFYWQSDSFWRVFNDLEYDRLHGYKNLNLTLIFTNQNGWQVMLYDKNVFNTTAITGAFLNSDDTGLTTNVFLTDPKLIGIRVTKNW